MTSIVQETSWTTGSSGGFSSPVSVGNTVFLIVCDYNVGGGVISTSSPLYNGASVTGATKLFEVQNTGTRMYSGIWMLPNVQTSGTSVSFTDNNGSNDVNSGKYIIEVAGLGTAPTIDTGTPDPATNFQVGGGTISSGPTGALAASAALILGCFMNNNTATGPGAPWTVWANPGNGNVSSAGYQIVSSSGGTYTYSMGSGTPGEWSAGVVAIVPSGGNVNVSEGPAQVTVAAHLGTASSLTVATTSVAHVVQGVAVRRWLSASGGTAPYTWAVTAGSLPLGLSVASDGTLSGTPTATGTSTFTVRVTDANSLTATASLSITSVSAPLSPSSPTTDGNGVITWSVSSAINSGPETIRVLNPPSPSNYPHGFLFTLPVQSGTDSTTYGNGLDTVRTLGLHNTYNLTVIEPSFPLSPWYADNPTDGTMLQETYMLQVVAWAAAQYGTGGEKNYLIGLSKSGIGGQGLFFRWPGLFYAVASWDFPAMMTGADGTDSYHGGMVGDGPLAVYATQDNFAANYQLSPANLTKWAAGQNFGSVKRVWIGDFFDFQPDVVAYDPELTTAGILHTYASVSESAHAWNPTPGWIGSALAAIIPPPGTYAGQTANVSVAAHPGVASSQFGVLVSASVKSSFGARSQVSSQATMEFEAGQPVQTSLTTLASDPWISMYPG